MQIGERIYEKGPKVMSFGPFMILGKRIVFCLLSSCYFFGGIVYLVRKIICPDGLYLF